MKSDKKLLQQCAEQLERQRGLLKKFRGGFHGTIATANRHEDALKSHLLPRQKRWVAKQLAELKKFFEGELWKAAKKILPSEDNRKILLRLGHYEGPVGCQYYLTNKGLRRSLTRGVISGHMTRVSPERMLSTMAAEGWCLVPSVTNRIRKYIDEQSRRHVARF